MKVLLADDQAMVRRGLRLILDDQPDIEVVGEAADGAEAVEPARRLGPDVCLVDISVTVRLLKHIAPPRTKKTSRPRRSRCPARELEVAKAIAAGRTNQEIAELFISLSTVKSHLASILGKLEVRNRVRVAAWAWENRLMDRGL